MALLAACEHLIISVGTFGWWAAFLRQPAVAGGSVQYYSARWETTNTQSHIAAHHYPPEWIAHRHGPCDGCGAGGCAPRLLDGC